MKRMKQLMAFFKALCRGAFVGLLFFLSVCFVACSDDEPNFPDPGIDMTQQQDVVVHRDTASTYVLTMNVSTPGGLKTLEIINPKDDALIEDLSGKYAGKKEFVLEYPIVLPDVDTVLNFNVRIVDEQLRVINKPVTLTVKATSRPTIELIGFAENMVIENPTFTLKAKFETGMNTIKEYKLFFGDELLDSGVPEGEVSSYDYEFLCKLQMDWHVSYSLQLVLVDNKQQETTSTINLTLRPMSRPKRVVVESYFTGQETAHDFVYMDLTYDENDFLKKIGATKEKEGEVIGRNYYTFEYNEQMMVSKLEDVLENKNGTSSVAYLFNYEAGTKKLLSAQRETSGGIDPATEVTVTSWDENGFVTSFLRGATARVEDIHYTMNGDEKVLSEYLWTATSVSPIVRRHFVDMTPVVWPTYCPELLPFFAEIVPSKHILNLFCCKYIFNKRVYTNENGNHFKPGDTAATYTYALDENQRVKTVTVSETKLGYQDRGIFDIQMYTFEYED